MNPNFKQAIDDVEASEKEIQEDIDWDLVYGGEDIAPISSEKSPELKNDYAKILKDVLKQGAKETLIGVGGAYGDLQELLGLRPDQESQKKKSLKEHETLQNLDEKGKASLSDIMSLSEDSDLPRTLDLPTSGEIREASEFLGGPGEAETTPGKLAGRIGSLYGQGAAFGAVNPIPAIIAGTAGQAVEELGGGPLLQSAAEIAGLIASQGKSWKTNIANKNVQQKVDALRNLGYTDEQITLAINSAYKDGKATALASKSARTEQAFEDFASKSDDVISDILSSEVPGIEKGTKHIHEMASDAYAKVVEDASKIKIKNLDPFFGSMENALKDAKKSVGHNPDAKNFIQELTDHTLDIIANPSADNMIDFYKRLNGLGRWVGRNQKDRIISKVKDSIKDTFRSEGKDGKRLADEFEKVNKGIQKAYKAEDMMDLLNRAKTQEGFDYKKLNKLFDKQDNFDLFKDVLGEKQANNLKLIANTGKDIKDFDKSWKAANAFRLGTGADLLRGAAGYYYLYNGDWEGLAKVAVTKAGTTAIKKIAELSLRDPKFQNLTIRGLHAIKSASPQLMKSAQEAMKKHLDEEGIDIDLE